MSQPKTIVITGASDGIGAAAARRLSAEGHRVVVIGRSRQKTEAVAAETGADHYVTDFTRLDEVRALAAELNSAYPRIDVLANNAGGIFARAGKTVDGFEQTFQINHLAPFLLTRLLLDTLIASRATVIQTSSVGARMAGKLDLDDLDLDRNFDSLRAYNAAKLENILFTTELHRRYHEQGIAAVAHHPGNVQTSFGSATDSRLIKFVIAILSSPLVHRFLLLTPDKGAEQLVWFARSTPGADWTPGGYYEKGKPAKRTNPQAGDSDLARRLWDRSEDLLGLGAAAG
ncbi:SDR family NAD(P)-dependent oxidoreductase [Amycolatopsis sp. GM8]|uniref:SDR family NAD(P)-dependent oxidoreductase n=1 Tax=Amycolatopsis sp. GM8 TaxID=2896530 RepID=UPI001F2AD655|nr:SDR family NAD(P)-dependent oxidoreductase [Amycolatopsis sp. GM8]